MYRLQRRRLPSRPSVPGRRPAVSAVVAGLAAALLALVLSAPARADFSFSQHVNSGKNENFCMGISGAFVQSGTEALLFSCTPGGEQEFRFLGGVSDTRIIANHSKLCLRLKNNSLANGAQVVQGSCSSVSAHWRLTNLFEGLSSRQATIVNRHSGKCIGFSGGFVFHGAKLQAFNCGDGMGDGRWVVNPNRRLMPV